MRPIGIMNGPNLGRLGLRQPAMYGSTTLQELEDSLQRAFPELDLRFFQSNHEGALIDQLEAWHDAGVRHIVLNAGAFTHQSYALRDALEGLGFHAVEVHISNIYKREEFRHQSLLAPVVLGQIAGLGLAGYRLAVEYLRELDNPERGLL